MYRFCMTKVSSTHPARTARLYFFEDSLVEVLL